MALDLTPSLLAATTPSALNVTANVGSIVLDWTPGLLKNLQYIEVWRATTNNRASATLITTTFGDTYTDVDFVEGTDYYYWIRPKNIWGRNDAWYPTSSTGGVHVLSLTATTVSSILAYSTSVVTASSGSGMKTCTASSYSSSYQDTKTLITFTPAAGSSFVNLNNVVLTPSIGTASGGSDTDLTIIRLKIWLYDNTVAADVDNVFYVFDLATAVRFGGVWAVTKASDIINWPFTLYAGFLGEMIPENEYMIKAAILRERISGTTGTISASCGVSVSYTSSSMS